MPAMNDVAVRPVQQADRARWMALWAGYNAFYGRSGANALAPDVVDTTWRRFLDPGEPMHALVAERDGQLVGLAHSLFHRSTIQVQPTCYLQDLFTTVEARGAGVGRKLVLAVYDLARAAGSPRVYWQTHETNTVAMRLYDTLAERSGFLVYRKLL
jgi:GNAT superfamily N-acetyltransferase